MKRVNVGCGMTPTSGWLNYDNSLSLRIALMPKIFAVMLTKINLIDGRQKSYIEFCRQHNIRWCNATKHLPFEDNSMEVIYSSHMLEHLDQKEAIDFLKEAHRVLMEGGIIRLAVPGLRKKVQDYTENGDADRFIESLHTCVPKPISFRARLKLLLVGPRQHHWMYDENSLCSLLWRSGFRNAQALTGPGDTTIKNPGSLDLCERQEESIYAEAVKSNEADPAKS